MLARSFFLSSYNNCDEEAMCRSAFAFAVTIEKQDMVFGKIDGLQLESERATLEGGRWWVVYGDESR